MVGAVRSTRLSNQITHSTQPRCNTDRELPTSATHRFGEKAGPWARPARDRKYGERVPLSGTDGWTVHLYVRANLELVPAAVIASSSIEP